MILLCYCYVTFMILFCYCSVSCYCYITVMILLCYFYDTVMLLTHCLFLRPVYQPINALRDTTHKHMTYIWSTACCGTKVTSSGTWELIYIYIYICIYCVLCHEVFFLDNNSILICMSVGCCSVYRQSWQLSVQPDCTAWSNIRVSNQTAVPRRLMANSYSRVDVNMQGMLALNWVYCYCYYYYYYWLNNLLI
jgi:hypothetical protein